MSVTYQPMGGDCPEDIAALRTCICCEVTLDRNVDDHVMVKPSWRRCNECFCALCWDVLLKAAKRTIEARLEVG